MSKLRTLYYHQHTWLVIFYVVLTLIGLLRFAALEFTASSLPLEPRLTASGNEP